MCRFNCKAILNVCKILSSAENLYTFQFRLKHTFTSTIHCNLTSYLIFYFWIKDFNMAFFIFKNFSFSISSIVSAFLGCGSFYMTSVIYLHFNSFLLLQVVHRYSESLCEVLRYFNILIVWGKFIVTFIFNDVLCVH